MSNLEVLRYWRMVCCDNELTVRRLKWYQSMAANKMENVQNFATLFGTMKAELASPHLVASLEDGSLGPGANPWAMQFAQDMEKLWMIEDSMALMEQIGKKYLLVFTNEELCEEFQAVDVSVLRAMELCVAIAPPGLEKTKKVK